MKSTAYTLMFLYVCLNLSLYMIAETEVLPTYQQPYESPTAIADRLAVGLIAGTISFGLGSMLLSLLAGALAGLAVFAIQFFVGKGNIFDWAFYGLPNFISQIVATSGIDSSVANLFNGVIIGLTSVVWFWFLIQLFSQRYLER